MKQRGIAVLLVGMLAWTELSAQQTASTTFRVSASVQAACEVTATDLDFGTHAAQAGSPLPVTTLLRTTCTPNSSYNIGLNEGTSLGATVNLRRMVSDADAFNTVTGVGTGYSQDHRVFGAVPAAQVIPAGGYADTITVRIYY